MSRSRRHTPICGTTLAASEKQDKALAHRAFRAGVRSTLRSGEHEMPSHRLYGDPWTMAKDGKGFLSPSVREKCPELMRK